MSEKVKIIEKMKELRKRRQTLLNEVGKVDELFFRLQRKLHSLERTEIFEKQEEDRMKQLGTLLSDNFSLTEEQLAIVIKEIKQLKENQ